MTTEFFEPWNAKAESLAIVNQANEIIKEYQEDGYTLTLRQLYYQFVARDLIENSERSYKNLGTMMTKARMAGMVDWWAIEDRNRSFRSYYTEEDPLNLIRGLPDDITFDQWLRQDNYVEVWVEKEALGNVISRACQPYMVPYMSCKGYLSASALYRAGKRFEQKLHDGKECTIIHLGDHDPSGIDMTRDNQDRVDLFSNWPEAVNVRRIALNMDQVHEHRPPPNPTKVTDSRAKDYIKQYGHTSWELDALDPGTIRALITGELEQLIDRYTWAEVKEQEEETRGVLRKLVRNWDDVVEYLEERDDD